MCEEVGELVGGGVVDLVLGIVVEVECDCCG